MPLYDYRCTQCGHEVEVMHGIDGAGPSTCDVCGGAMRKALSPPAIVFKGSGWAKKDARSGSSTSKPDSGGAAKQDSGDKSGSSSETASSTSPDTTTSSKPASTGGTAAD